MSAPFIAPLVGIEPSTLAPLQLPLPSGHATPEVSFGSIVSAGLRGMSEQLQAGEVDLQRLASGDVENLHQVMIRLEEARLSFQLMLQVRNRVLESYQEVMRMQV